MTFTVLEPMKTRNGITILKEGDVLRHIPKYGNYDVYGTDTRNKFWTDEFLLSKPHLFRVNP